jgi:hypothetical protein
MFFLFAIIPLKPVRSLETHYLSNFTAEIKLSSAVGVRLAIGVYGIVR